MEESPNVPNVPSTERLSVPEACPQAILRELYLRGKAASGCSPMVVVE